MKNLSKILIYFIFIVFLFNFFSIELYPGWFKRYGGNQNEFASSIQQTSDGGYIFAGRGETFAPGGQYDLNIFKLDSNGDKVWMKAYGGILNDGATSIQQIPGGGYIVAGHTNSYTHGGQDFAIYKLDSAGNKVWFKHYGGTQWDSAQSIQQIPGGSYIVVGMTKSYTYGNYDFAIYKLDSNGNKLWFKHYGGTGDDRAFSIHRYYSTSFVVAGLTTSYTYGSEDIAIYKLDSDGNKQWFKHYGGTQDDIALSIRQTSDYGYIVAGHTKSYTYGNDDFAIYKLNSNGNKVWFKHYGGAYSDVGTSVQQTTDSGFVMAGHSFSYSYNPPSYPDHAIYKLDSNGNK